MPDQSGMLGRVLPGPVPGHVTRQSVTFEQDYHVPDGLADPPLTGVAAVCSNIRHIAFTVMIVGACCVPLTILAVLMWRLIGLSG